MNVPLPANRDKNEKIHLVILDDVDSIREVMNLFFEQHGQFIVRLAKTGAQAIRIAEQERVDVLMSDLDRPDEDAFEFLRVFKQRFPSARMIVFSGFPDAEDSVKGLSVSLTVLKRNEMDMEDFAKQVARVAESASTH